MLPILQNKSAGVRDPVCGMLVDPQKAAGSVAHQGATYYFCSKGCAAKFQADPVKYLQPAAAPEAVRDPVCGMTVDPQQAAGSVTYQGETYYFCSKGCAAKFQADPEKYLQPAAASEPMQPAPVGVEYTCPMHPEVRQIGPGSCPKCGMALEPVSVTRESVDEVNPEYTDMLRRFWLSVPPSAVLLGMMFAGVALAVVGTGAGESGGAVGGMADLRSRLGIDRESQPEHVHADRRGRGRGLCLQLDRDDGAGDFPATRFGSTAQLALYFEPAAVIVCLVLLGQVLELRARSQTSSAIKALLGLAPKTARRIRADGTEEDVRARSRASWRPAAGAAWRERSGGRRGDGRARVPWTNR